MQTLAFDEQKFNNYGLNTVSNVVGNIGIDSERWDFFVAALIEDGKINEPRLNRAKKLLAAKEALDAERRQKAEAADAERRAAFNDPLVAFPRLFNRRNGNPSELIQWLEKTPIADLEKLLAQLRSNSQHWSSLYRGIADAMEFLDQQITKLKTGGKKAR
jgi:hypothetical protein